ncbi:porin [Roseobacter sp. YSTF-M11]|uniref:Porin n=1 Tax=Roseobacter insulae TaxID=2859783 RepID=A0A9X1FS04_9RHOB|nr:porin [Roseobacter insulae]MBW4706563.1 porin [Roseobacter insulae]
MKKLLIATTALVGTAGVVAAETTFGGYGRFGILYEEDRGGGTQEETRIESRYRLNIDSSTETDGGVRFAARIRVEANENANNSANQGVFSGARFQVNTGGLRVRVGNISGVTDAANVVNYFGYEPGLVGQTGQYANSGVSLPAFSSTGAGNNGINVLYEMGDFKVMASYTDDHTDNLGGAGATAFGDSFEIGASYTFSAWTLGAVVGQFEGAGSTVENDWWVATLSGTLGIADVSFLISDFDGDDDTVFGASTSIPVGAATNVVASVSTGGDDANDTSYGLGFTHSLGGGVSLSGMAGSNAAGNTIADLGVRFNF